VHESKKGAHVSKRACMGGGEGSGGELGMIWARETWAHTSKGARIGKEAHTGRGKMHILQL
jgi:hypothetical protein